MLTIPFANPILPLGGPAADGVVYGVLPQVAPVTALSMRHAVPFTKVLRGNADAAGGLAYADVTAAANNDAPGDVALFDTVNPGKDQLCIELSEGDEIDGISLLVTMAAAGLVGSAGADVYYRTATGWASAVAIVTPLLTSTGLKKITFLKSQGPDVALRYADVAPIDNLIDPRDGAQMRCLFVRFSGLTGVTTAPTFSRVWKNAKHTATHSSVNVTAALALGAAPDLSALNTEAIPAVADRMLFGFDGRPVRLFPTVYRRRPAGHAVEWIYSTAQGFAALPAAAISDPSDALGAAIGSQNTPSSNLTSTLTTGVWGGSGAGSTNFLQGDGYVQFRVGANPALALMIGFSLANANDSYTSIGWAVHTGHAATAFGSQWVNGIQQSGGTWAIATGDVIRVERRSGVFRLYQNGTLRHTWSQTSTADVLVDTAFISLSAVTHLVLVRTARGYDEPVTITWGTATALTIAAGVAVAIDDRATHQVAIVPPSDWAALAQVDEGGTTHTRFWVGLRTTADGADVLSPVTLTLRGQPSLTPTGSGIPAPETATYTRATVVSRDVSLADATLLVVNRATGAVASVTVPSGQAIATAVVSFAVTKGDEVVVVDAIGHATVGLGDGAIFLS